MVIYTSTPFLFELFLGLAVLPNTHGWQCLIGEWDLEVLLNIRIEKPQRANVARVSPEREFALRTGLLFDRIYPRAQRFGVIAHTIDCHAKGLHGPPGGG